MSKTVIEISGDIISQSVVSDSDIDVVEKPIVPPEEKVERGAKLSGVTYKLSVPDHVHRSSLYITMNDKILSDGTKIPFEMFINSQSIENYQWVVGVTRLISAVFRKGGKYRFLAEELQLIVDPIVGMYHKGGGKSRPSLLADIAYVMESHFDMIDEYNLGGGGASSVSSGRVNTVSSDVGEDVGGVIGELCHACMTHSVVSGGGCSTCANCGESVCG